MSLNSIFIKEPSYSNLSDIIFNSLFKKIVSKLLYLIQSK